MLGTSERDNFPMNNKMEKHIVEKEEDNNNVSQNTESKIVITVQDISESNEERNENSEFQIKKRNENHIEKKEVEKDNKIIESKNAIKVENKTETQEKEKKNKLQLHTSKKEDNNKIENIKSEIKEKEDDYDSEVKELLENKEKRLTKKFNEASDFYNSIKLYEIIYGEQKNVRNEIKKWFENRRKKNQNEEEIEDIEKIKEEKKKNIYCGCRCLKIYLFGFFYFIFYLTGFFQLLDLFDACKKELGIIFKSFFYNTERESNETFVDLYINSCLRNIPEFDFAFFTSILGTLPLKYCGFFFSSTIFTTLNSVLFVGFRKFDFEKKKFDVIDFLYILLCFFIFFIIFGAISLFAHQKFSEAIIKFDDIKKYYEAKLIELINNDDENKNKENAKEDDKNKNKGCCGDSWKESSLFVFLSIGIIIAYIINRGINIIIYKFYKNIYEEYFTAVFVTIYVGTYIMSLILYLFFNIEIILIKSKKKKNYKNKIEFYKIFGFIIYYEKISIDNEIKDENEQEKNENEQNKVNTNQNNLNVGNQNNIDIYNLENKTGKINEKIKNRQDNSLIDKNRNENIQNTKKNKNNNTNKEITYSDIFCKLIFPCYNNLKKENENSKYCCASCKLGFKKCYYKTVDTEFEPVCHYEICKCQQCCSLCSCCQCCECCKIRDLNESYTDQEIFCYVYQVQRKCSWFCDLFFKNNILSLIIHNLCVELGIVGYEKKLNDNLEDNNLYDNFITIIIYLGYFSFFTFLFTGFFVCRTKNEGFNYFSWYSIIYSIIIAILSGISYFGIEKKRILINDRIHNIIIMIPIAYTKFINLVVMNTLVKISDDDNEMDILSSSFVLTSIFVIYDIIVFMVIDFLDLEINTLILIQLLSAIIFSICHLFSLNKKIIKDLCKKKNEN